jgi:dihydroorotate dehydrogenase (NAD+) catalytic subunit
MSDCMNPPGLTSANCDLTVELPGMVMQNPVMTASGTFGYGEEYSCLYDINGLGAIVVKATTIKPRLGNQSPRVVEVAAGMLSCCGLQNVGVDSFIADKLPFLQKLKIPIIVNIAADSIADFVIVSEKVSQAGGIAAIELNVSCPNVKQGGMSFGVDPVMVHKVVSEVKRVSAIPVICKLTPNVTDIVSIAVAAEEGGADAISLINGLLGMAIDVETRKPKLGNVTGGLSGPAIKPVAVRMVWQVAGAVSIPVIGIGGITTAEDALEFIIAGAKAVQVGTANFFRPMAALEIIEGIRSYLQKQGLTNIRELSGSLQLPPLC